MSKYKTYEELKEELGNKFDEYMYKSNIELLNKIDKAIETINLMIYKGYTISNEGTSRSYMATSENSEFGVRAKELLEILKGDDSNE